jgi:hypothetical protein
MSGANETFCGHVYREVVYTKEHKGVVWISSAKECVYLKVVYQALIKGYAFTFNNQTWQTPQNWYIQFPHPPSWTVYAGNVYHFTWFYTKPAVNIVTDRAMFYEYVRRRRRSRLKVIKDFYHYQLAMNYARMIYYIYLDVFICQTNKSFLYVQDGLDPIKNDNRHVFKCNSKYKMIPTLKSHKFIRVDLTLDVLDPNVKVIMSMSKSYIAPKAIVTEVLSDMSSQIDVPCYDHPQIYYSKDKYIHLTITRFDFQGRQKNVKEAQVHILPLKTSIHGADLAKGNFSLETNICKS